MSTSTTGMNDDLQRLTLEQDALLVEARRRLAVRDRIDDKRRIAQRQAERHRIEERVLVESKHTGEMAMTKLDRPTIPSKRLPASGNSALAASALIQAALVQLLVLPHISLFAGFIEVTELLVGAILLIGAVEIGRRRFSGRLGAQHGYEAPVALVSALAGLAAAGLALSIGMLMGEGLPAIMPGRDLTTAIPVELLIVPLGIAIAWLELGRFLVLRRVPATSAMTSGRRDQQPQAA